MQNLLTAAVLLTSGLPMCLLLTLLTLRASSPQQVIRANSMTNGTSGCQRPMMSAWLAGGHVSKDKGWSRLPQICVSAQPTDTDRGTHYPRRLTHCEKSAMSLVTRLNVLTLGLGSTSRIDSSYSRYCSGRVRERKLPSLGMRY